MARFQLRQVRLDDPDTSDTLASLTAGLVVGFGLLEELDLGHRRP